MPSADVGRVEVDANAWLVDLLRVALVRVNVVPQQHFCPQFAHVEAPDDRRGGRTDARSLHIDQRLAPAYICTRLDPLGQLPAMSVNRSLFRQTTAFSCPMLALCLDTFLQSGIVHCRYNTEALSYEQSCERQAANNRCS